MVRAKFKCVENKDNGAPDSDNKGSTITLRPVVGGSAENDEFYRWTPGGEVVLSTVNPSAAEQFEVGKQYFVDFTPA